MVLLAPRVWYEDFLSLAPDCDKQRLCLQRWSCRTCRRDKLRLAQELTMDVIPQGVPGRAIASNDGFRATERQIRAGQQECG
jgi:hypothetical protein